MRAEVGVARVAALRHTNSDVARRVASLELEDEIGPVVGLEPFRRAERSKQSLRVRMCIIDLMLRRKWNGSTSA